MINLHYQQDIYLTSHQHSIFFVLNCWSIILTLYEKVEKVYNSFWLFKKTIKRHTSCKNFEAKESVNEEIWRLCYLEDLIYFKNNLMCKQLRKTFENSRTYSFKFIIFLCGFKSAFSLRCLLSYFWVPFKILLLGIKKSQFHIPFGQSTFVLKRYK